MRRGIRRKRDLERLTKRCKTSRLATAQFSANVFKSPNRLGRVEAFSTTLTNLGTHLNGRRICTAAQQLLNLLEYQWTATCRANIFRNYRCHDVGFLNRQSTQHSGSGR